MKKCVLCTKETNSCLILTLGQGRGWMPTHPPPPISPFFLSFPKTIFLAPTVFISCACIPCCTHIQLYTYSRRRNALSTCCIFTSCQCFTGPPPLNTIDNNNKLGFRPRILKNLSSRHQTEQLQCNFYLFLHLCTS